MVAAPRRGDDDTPPHTILGFDFTVAAPRRGDDDYAVVTDSAAEMLLLPLEGAMTTDGAFEALIRDLRLPPLEGAMTTSTT